ncbi:MAG: hypothetical protein NTW19_03195 [Planctomycetota bacterium]|nr:hypothetical protein [Planctomycetota bacterium]
MTQTLTPTPVPPAANDAAPPYQRVDLDRIERREADAVTEAHAGDPARLGFRWVVILLSAVLCVAQAFLTIVAANVHQSNITSTLIPVLAFAVLFILVLAVNPAMRLVQKALGSWSRPLNRVELVAIFSAMLVTAGVSTFGLTEQLIPLLVTPSNPEWNIPQRGWDKQLNPTLNPSLYIQDPKAIDVFRHGVTQTATGEKIAPPRDTAPIGEYVAYYRTVFAAVPWGKWIPPLTCWMVFIAGCYGIFYFLTYVLLGYWSDREKIIFPLSRLTEALLPGYSEGKSWVPAIFSNPGFWLGFALSFATLAWNGTTTSGGLPGLFPVPLGMTNASVNEVIRGTVLSGLTGRSEQGVMFLIIFTAIGIAFLLPLEISFSIWFYYLVGRAIMLLHVWLGYGQAMADFPSDWLWYNNPVSALGGGGIFLFSAVSLFRCVRDYFKLIAGKTASQRFFIALPIIGLVACMAVVSSWLMWNRVPAVWAFVFVFILTLLTIGLMRIVAEGGIYWFQSHTSFFHVYKMLGLGTMLPATLLAPLLPIYSVLFLDTKTFLAPNLMTSAHLQKDAGGSRFKFHLNIVLCLALSVAASFATAIVLAHARGGQAMQGWFYNSATPMMMDTAQRAITTAPHFDIVTTAWYVLGAAWVGLSLYVRSWLFWFPHPVGLIMLINPLAAQLWFSFFIGWIFKKLTVKYGGKATFDRVRLIFIGLILGELLAIFFWTFLAMVYHVRSSNITLNRYN